MSPGPPTIEGFPAAADVDAIEEDVAALLDCCNYKKRRSWDQSYFGIGLMLFFLGR